MAKWHNNQGTLNLSMPPLPPPYLPFYADLALAYNNRLGQLMTGTGGGNGGNGAVLAAAAGNDNVDLNRYVPGIGSPDSSDMFGSTPANLMTVECLRLLILTAL